MTAVAAQLVLERTHPPCDRDCPATAQVIVRQTQPVGGPLELAFCSHDYTDNEPLLVLAGWVVVGDTRPHLAHREATR